MSRELFTCVHCMRVMQSSDGKITSGLDPRVMVCSQCYETLGRDLSKLKPPASLLKPEPTKLTRDQAIRAKALEIAAATRFTEDNTMDAMLKTADTMADYIRNGVVVPDPEEEKYNKRHNFHRSTDGYDLSVRTSNLLDWFIVQRFNRAIKTPEEFCGLCSPRQFLKSPNVGRKSLNELKAAFAENGIEWGDYIRDGRKGDE